ncbi:rhomboid family intramembrane serine protease [Oceanirhabdus seepicola]|uniref:Rhomboid family intramembrane serine protease n=1 Tax=Oceanirhabdus seepicola TaxID=2828781 RepID=A0A9J6P0N4_9CLOT|nr:rhomboid family intramembrane serine protease [Oceanirhabdus seepicola]MCM1989758.1 rhomboid family intramembrane serine protease [Oceanirhabdus seepicola]
MNLSLGKIKGYIKDYPITTIIILINTLIVIFVGLKFGFKNIGEVSRSISSVTKVKEGNYWMMFTYTFLHINIPHYFINTFFIICFSGIIEYTLGKAKFLLFFIITVLGSSIVIFFFNPGAVLISSGFVFGILGYYMYIVFLKKDMISNPKFKGNLIKITIICWILSFLYKDVNIVGHLGGFITGFIFSMVELKISASNK